MFTPLSLRQIAGGAFSFFVAGVFLASLGMAIGKSVMPEAPAKRLSGTIGCGFGTLSEAKCGSEIPLIAHGDELLTLVAAADMQRLGTPEAGDRVEILARQKQGILVAEALRLSSTDENESGNFGTPDAQAYVLADDAALIDL